MGVKKAGERLPEQHEGEREPDRQSVQYRQGQACRVIEAQQRPWRRLKELRVENSRERIDVDERWLEGRRGK